MADEIRITGAAEAKAKLDALIPKLTAAGRQIVSEVQTVAEDAAKRQFTGAHSAGQPTTSAPGSPPDVVTGTLRRSIQRSAPELVARGWQGTVFPSVVYARIQELGGATGRGGSTILPARPYMEPANDEIRAQARRIAVRYWTAATHT